LVQISTLDPAMPPRESLEPLVLELARASGPISSLPEPTLKAFREMMRVAEAHHSLAIDGHRVHPLHIEQAIRGELSDDASVRGLQREALAYHRTERFVAGRMADEPAADPASPPFLKLVHWELYSRVPEEFRWVADSASPGVRHRIAPGEFRGHALERRGSTVPPPSIESTLGRFRGHYDIGKLSAVERIVAAAASHHRLLWIQPFVGGNGRVTRLFSAAYLQRAGIDGALLGLWSMSRGLARGRDRHRQLLAAADIRQRNDLDGRDVLSPRALLDFTRFFLETCRDELAFARREFRIEVFTERIASYVRLRAAGDAPGGALHPESASLLRDVACRGEVPRGEAGRITGMATSEARKVLSALVKERLLVSDSPKGPVRLCLPAHAAPFLFPDLYPRELILGSEPRSVIEAA
jgi:Fic family protein